VWAETIENAAHFHDRSSQTDLFAKNFRAIWGRKNGLADIEPNLAAVNIKCGHHFDVSRTVRPDLPMHEADAISIGD
jgi:hypothetical protein